MKRWSAEFEEEITVLIKDWLKNKERTQADLRVALQTNSSRMPVLLEALQKEYSSGGLPKLAALLCSIENKWDKSQTSLEKQEEKSDPFNQLDLLLEKMRVDCEN